MNSPTKKTNAATPFVAIILLVAVSLIVAALALGFMSGFNSTADATVEVKETTGEQLEITLETVHTADHIYVESSNGPLTSSAGAYNWTSPNENPAGTNHNQFLLTKNTGGTGTTVTLNTTNNGYANNTTISVIGILNGEETTIKTYKIQ